MALIVVTFTTPGPAYYQESVATALTVDIFVPSTPVLMSRRHVWCVSHTCTRRSFTPFNHVSLSLRYWDVYGRACSHDVLNRFVYEMVQPAYAPPAKAWFTRLQTVHQQLFKHKICYRRHLPFLHHAQNAHQHNESVLVSILHVIACIQKSQLPSNPAWVCDWSSPPHYKDCNNLFNIIPLADELESTLCDVRKSFAWKIGSC